MKTTKSLFPWFSGAPRSEKETPQPQFQTINPMEQHQTQPQTNRQTPNPTQKQTPNQTTPTMKLRNPLDAMNFFQTLHNWALRPLALGEGNSATATPNHQFNGTADTTPNQTQTAESETSHPPVLSADERHHRLHHQRRLDLHSFCAYSSG